LPRPRSADIIRSGGKGSFALKLPAFLIFSSLIFVLACGSGDSDDESSSVPRAPTDASAIRNVDFEGLPEAQTMIQQLGGGEVEGGAVLFADLTGDQREEAVVPVTSQGTLGNVGYLVLTMDSGKPRVVLTRTIDRSTASGLKMTAEDGVLLETRGVYGNEDPLCCPSQLRETTFRWDGSVLQVGEEKLVQQAPAKN
jgi:hypothetical protein